MHLPENERGSLCPWRREGDCLVLVVRVTPRGGRDAIDGVEQLADGTPVLKARVRAAPEDGQANAALLALIAKALGVSRRQVSLESGSAARIKHLRITAFDIAMITRLEALCPARA